MMKKNIIYSMLYQILILILPLITVPYVSRVIGADGIGIYSYTYSIVYYFIILAMLGLNNYGNRTIAKVRDDKEKMSKEFWSIYAMQLITTTTMIICYLGYIFIFDPQYKNIAIIQIIYLISTAFDINWFYFGIEKFKLTITRNTIIKLISLFFIFILVKEASDTWKYVMILAISTLVSNIVLFSFLNKYVTKVKIEKSDIVKHIKPCCILFLPVIAVSIYKMMDKIMLGLMSNVKEVGYYENAEKIVQVPVGIIGALGTVMLPRVSNMLSKNQEEGVKQLLAKTIPFVMFLSMAMAMGISMISNDFSIIFFGNEFEKSGLLIKILSITIIFLAWGNVIRTQYLIPKEKDKTYIISAFLGAIINFIINAILIPKYASIGACIGTVLAEFFVMFYQSYVIRKELNFKEYIKKSSIFVIKAIIMAIVVYIIGKIFDKTKLEFKVILQVIGGSLIYMLMNIKYILCDLQINHFLKRIKGEKI